jgi:LysR family nitrogen assimilation transcriptional regulator
VDIRQLKYFLVIARCGSFSQAARKLYVVQSALSHNIAHLEDELGTQLFNRHPRGVQLTKAGELLCDYATQVLNLVTQAKNEIGDVKSDLKEYVWVGLNYTISQVLMPSLVKRLSDEFPNIKLGIEEDLSAVLTEHLIEGKLDVAVVYNPIEDESINTIPLFTENVCCVGNTDFLGNTSEPIKFSEILKLPMILAGQGENIRGVISDNDLRQKLSDACVMEVNSLSALLSVLQGGLGCTALSASTICNYSGQRKLVARPITEPNISRTLHIMYLKHTKNDALLEKVSLLMKAHVYESVAFKNGDIELIE